MKQKRFAPDVRKDSILAVACRLACAGTPYDRLTREQIAVAAGVTGPAVQYHFKTMAQLQRAVMRYAVANSVLPVVAQGLAGRDPQALKAPTELRHRAAASLNV